MADALVIGYGNDLRGDDGAGRWVADEIEALDLPGVVVRSVVQLTPELALVASGCDRVVFIDADIDVPAVRVRRVVPDHAGSTTLTHHCGPAALLAMVEAVGEAPADAHVVSIPATDLEIGQPMTPAAMGGAVEAMGRVLALAAARSREDSDDRGALSSPVPVWKDCRHGPR